jgi:uncharacterized membrane protein YidH (DUF202 family)
MQTGRMRPFAGSSRFMAQWQQRNSCVPTTARKQQQQQQHLMHQTSAKRSFWTSPEEIANTGSTARDILATERTFLAWSRTGLGFVGAGSALAAAYHREHASLDMAPSVQPASALLIGNGAFLLLFATRRYCTVLEALRRDKFPIHTAGTLWAVAVTSVNTVASLAIVARAELLAASETT